MNMSKLSASAKSFNPVPKVVVAAPAPTTPAQPQPQPAVVLPETSAVTVTVAVASTHSQPPVSDSWEQEEEHVTFVPPAAFPAPSDPSAFVSPPAPPPPPPGKPVDVLSLEYALAKLRGCSVEDVVPVTKLELNDKIEIDDNDPELRAMIEEEERADRDAESRKPKKDKPELKVCVCFF